ncbi:MAG: histidinol-phosphate transaminase [Polyangiales bacterium]
MSSFIPPHILSLQAYEPGKPEEELRRELGIESIVKLASNENAFGPSPHVLDALSDGARALHRYPDPRGTDLREALAAHHQLEPAEITLGNGSNELIDLLCRVSASRGDHVVYCHPSFPCYHIGAIAQELVRGVVPLRDDLHYDVDALLGAITPQTRLLFVANPNNPTGSYIGEAGLTRLLKEAPDHVLVVIDEAYVEYANADDFRCAMDLRSLRSRLAILRTFSKAYGLAALRVGYVIAPPEVVHTINRLRAPFNVGSMGQRLACVALEDTDHVRRTVSASIEEREALRAALEARGFEVAPSQANFLLVRTAGPGRAVYEALLRQGVIVRPMGPPLEASIRVTVGRPEENARFLDALTHVLKDSRG